jgi:hypothetical protein
MLYGKYPPKVFIGGKARNLREEISTERGKIHIIGWCSESKKIGRTA